jgi:chromosome segregation ATPase
MAAKDAALAAAQERIRESEQNRGVLSDRIRELNERIAALEKERDEAREACPAIRMQKFFDAPLLTLVQQEIRQLFWMQSRAEQAESRAERAEGLLKRCRPFLVCLQRGEIIVDNRSPRTDLRDAIDAALAETGGES